MLKKGIFATLFVLALLGLFAPTTTALAQTYLFNLDREDVNVFLNEDGTAAIDYVLDFTNDPSASPIDFVDLGLPNSSYDLSTITADVNGKPVQSIDKADPQNLAGGGSGITLSLGSSSIQPGTSGRVHVTVPIVQRVLYPGTDSNHPDYASFQFSPNYFGSQYVKDGTDLTVTIHLPPGVQTTEFGLLSGLEQLARHQRARIQPGQPEPHPVHLAFGGRQRRQPVYLWGEFSGQVYPRRSHRARPFLPAQPGYAFLSLFRRWFFGHYRADHLRQCGGQPQAQAPISAAQSGDRGHGYQTRADRRRSGHFNGTTYG